MNKHHHILKAIYNGDKAAFSELYTLYKNLVYSTALNFAQNPADAEEITQDVFVSVFKNAKGFKYNSAVSTWLYRITVNKSLTFIKRKKALKQVDFNENDFTKNDFNHPAVLLENKESAATMFAAIETLPENQKTAFILSFVDDLPRQEVADIMEMKLKAVESLLQRAKANLREKLKNMYPNRRK